MTAIWDEKFDTNFWAVHPNNTETFWHDQNLSWNVFSTLAVPGLVAHFDFTKASSLWVDNGVTNVSVDGDYIYRVSDLSGNGNDLVQVTSANRPKWKSSQNTFNNLPCLDVSSPLTASPHFLFQNTFNQDATAMYVYAVVDTTTLGNGNRLLLHSNSGVSGVSLYLSSGSLNPTVYWNNGNRAAYNAYEWGPMIIRYKVPVSNTTGVRVNDCLEVVGAVVSPSTVTTWGYLFSNEPTQHAEPSFLAEMLIYHGHDLTTEEDNLIMTYLNNKYKSYLTNKPALQILDTTWDVNFSSLTYSNGNLTINKSTAGYLAAKSLLGISSGIRYWEVTVDAGTPLCMIGVAPNTFTNTNAVNFWSAGQGGYAYSSAVGVKWYNGVSSAFGQNIPVGAKVGVYLDMDQGKIWFSLNGVWQGSGNPRLNLNPAFTGLTGTLYPVVAVSTNTTATAIF